MSPTYNRFIKRPLDFFASFTALVIFLPVMMIIIILLFLTGHRKFFFVQQRVGLNEKVFNLVKFRSMTDRKDAAGNLLPDADRLTGMGKTLRRTSLDELPQLFNVLMGDMSIVGPRPLLVSYLPLYNDRQKQRHRVRPGITGWTQVSGRNALSWDKKLELDVWYVLNQSFSLDLKIIFLTIKHVVKAEGISQEGQATMEAFKGTKE